MIANYRPKRRWLIIGALVALFLAAIAITDLKKGGQTVQLPDGSKVTIAKITSGPEQRFLYGTAWARFTYSVVPAAFLEKEQGNDDVLTYRRFRDLQGRKAIFTPKEDSVILWVRHRRLDSSVSSYEWNYQVVTIGPDGRPFSTAEVHPIDEIDDRSIMAWELERFPRRGPKIECQLKTERGDKWENVARFSVLNPKHMDYPEWKPKPLPITKKHHGLTVKLTDVKTGNHPSYRHPGSHSTPYETRIGVEVHANGEPTKAWQPESFSWVDATGNRHRDEWDGVLYDNVNNEQGRVFNGLIGSSEAPAFRVCRAAQMVFAKMEHAYQGGHSRVDRRVGERESYHPLECGRGFGGVGRLGQGSCAGFNRCVG